MCSLLFEHLRMSVQNAVPSFTHVGFNNFTSQISYSYSSNLLRTVSKNTNAFVRKN
jgi:hypothetical protein